LLLVLVLAPGALAKTRVGDLGRFMGVRENQLVGFGLVIGLDGSGDRSGSDVVGHSMASLLEELGITLSPQDLKLRNVAAVLVTADLAPFARSGSRVDVAVSSIGSASDLRGGMLVQTPLKGADGHVYVVAQGPISLGGFQADAPGGGASIQKNHVTMGRIPSGGIVEREVLLDPFGGDFMEIVLDRPNFETAANVASAINVVFGSGVARARDGGTVLVPVGRIPADLDPVGFAARVEQIRVDVAREARVVINERTGTVVAGGDVRIAPVAIAHGGLTIEVTNQAQVSQAQPFAVGGQTVLVPQADVRVTEDASVVALAGTTSITELAEALNAMGVGASDVIAIFQALKEAGALDADLVVI
jgi:flagellar P-ring protein precursor FlgI